jgi:hypothetical protein
MSPAKQYNLITRFANVCEPESSLGMASYRFWPVAAGRQSAASLFLAAAPLATPPAKLPPYPAPPHAA